MGNRRCASRKTRCRRTPTWILSSRTASEKSVGGCAANSTGPAVAGTGEDSDTVVVKKKKRKTAIFKVTPEVFARFSKGKKKFERWNKYLNIEDEAEASIYSFARKNPHGMIILQCQDTGNQKGIRYNPNGGGSWGKIQRKNASLREFIDDRNI